MTAASSRLGMRGDISGLGGMWLMMRSGLRCSSFRDGWWLIAGGLLSLGAVGRGVLFCERGWWTLVLDFWVWRRSCMLETVVMYVERGRVCFSLFTLSTTITLTIQSNGLRKYFSYKSRQQTAMVHRERHDAEGNPVRELAWQVPSGHSQEVMIQLFDNKGKCHSCQRCFECLG